MMRVRLGLVVLACLLIFGVVLALQAPVQAAVEPTITNYYTPCKGGMDGVVSTWHGQNRDGQPPYDPNRRTYDFRCPDAQIYTPADGVVYGVTPKYGGVVLIEDAANKACMVFLGMKTIALSPKQEVRAGTFVGTYRLFHFTAVDGNCAAANFYDVEARQRERPIQFIEFGAVIPPDIRRPKVYAFTSQNPTLLETVPDTVALFFQDRAAICTDAAASDCPIALRSITLAGSAAKNDPAGQITAALTELFSVKDSEVGEDKLYNALAKSSLKVDFVEINPQAQSVTVYLNGTLRTASGEDVAVARAQIAETVQQFIREAETPRVAILLNNRPLAR